MITMRRRTKIILIAVVTLFVLAAAGAALYYIFVLKPVGDTKKKQATTDAAFYEEANTTIAQSGTSEADLQKVITEYGSEYEASSKDVRSASSDKWTLTEIDKAYLAITYADKMGLNSQVQDLYYQIASARASGADVDANSAQVTQQQLDAMKAKADAATSSATNAPIEVIK